MSHGAIAPARCVFTVDGRVVLTECGFVTVLERLNPGRRRLWRDFRVAIAPPADPARLDETADISQAALAAVMLVLGRTTGDLDVVDVLPEWLSDAIEIAQIRGNVSFAVNFQRFLQRALPLPGRRPYPTLDAALHDVRQLAEAIGIDLCRASIAECVRHATDREQGTSQVAAGTPRRAPADTHPAAVPPRVVEEPVVPIPEEPPRERIAPKPGFESFYEVAARAQPSPLGTSAPDPAVTPEPVAPIQWPTTEEATVEPAIEEITAGLPPAAAPPESIVEAPAAPEATGSGPSTAGERLLDPLDPAAVARRRRSRSKARWVDALRSAVTRNASPEEPESSEQPATDWAEPQEPTRERPVEPAPLVPVVPAQPVLPRPMVPAASTSAPVVPLPIVHQPVVPQPVFAPLAAAVTERLWEPPQLLDPAPVAPPPAPTAPAPVRPAPIKLKTSEPTDAARPMPYESRGLARRYTIPRAAAATGADRRQTWKFAAAAAIIIATIAAAARVYLLHDSAVNAEVKSSQSPVTVTAPPPVTTGTIVAQTQPEGARVLLDGSPAGETPLRIVDVAPGRHVLTFVTPTATVKRTVRVEANKTVTLDIPVFSGWVAIFAPVVLTVSEQGRTIGTTDQGRLLLPPGLHRLTLANPEFGYSADHVVDVEPGEVRSVNLQPTGTVNFNAVPWAEVWIDGKKIGDTPIANFTLPLGSREVVFRHPEYGERKVVARVIAGEPIAVTVDFSNR
jgi:hypothetical protein